MAGDDGPRTYDALAPPKPISLQGRSAANHPILTLHMAEQIRHYLPSLHREASVWSLVYSTDQHGISLPSLFSRSQAYGGPTVLVIEDTHGRKFGAFTNVPLAMRKGYYGNGSCFLFRLNERNSVTVYPATATDDYYVLSETRANIAFGASPFGLWIDDELLKGFTGSCTTYENEPLTGGARDSEFECYAVELWGFKL
ncbi:TLD-domain-containing protein [Gaertneriomyces semiglobifer]|nr:TLD-domain-containing protein [Gaertneriomyces semiglobifer]